MDILSLLKIMELIVENYIYVKVEITASEDLQSFIS